MTTTVCAHCKHPFTHHSRQPRTTCSKECRDAKKNGTLALKPKVCKICGKPSKSRLCGSRICDQRDSFQTTFARDYNVYSRGTK